MSLASGEEIEIEQRAGSEVTHFQGTPTAPLGVEAVIRPST